jgi:protein-S-isoprenylcysteine O-methyltransferase Ste14
MLFAPPSPIDAAWIALGLVWAVAAVAAKPVARVEPRASRIGHLLTFAVAFALLFSKDFRGGPLGWRVTPAAAAAGTIGLGLTIAGILFAIWARFYLGGNWSSVAAIKQDHTLVHNGPYSIVRHPIYAGLLLAMLGTALAAGELGAFLAVILAFAGWQAKARLEESFLLAQFGEAYCNYRAHVKGMIPFVL